MSTPHESTASVALELLRQHEKEIRQKFGVKRIGMFGSYARGNPEATSDVDILVDFKNPTFDNFMELAFYLEKLFMKEVDLVTTKGMSPYMSQAIENEVVWIGTGPSCCTF